MREYCAIDNLDLEACINILRDKRQDLAFAWEIEGMEVAPEFTLNLFNRINKLIKSFVIAKNIDGALEWNALASEFIDSEMTYSMTPTIQIPATWIELKGKIISR